MIALSDDARNALLKQISVRVGTQINQEEVEGIANMINNFDHDLTLWLMSAGDQVSITITPPGFRLSTTFTQRQ